MPFDLQPTLAGPNLWLRPLRPEDRDPLFDVASDPLIWEQHPAKERATEEGFDAFFRQSLESGGALVVVDTDKDRIVGSSRYHAYDESKSEIEIGWSFLAREYWGGAYNREMKSLMLDHAFRFVDRVVFLVAPGNIRSRKAMEKIGGVRAGVRPDAAGDRALVYEITASDWKG